MAKVIRDFPTAFGGIEFRATRHGAYVNLQVRSLDHARFYTKAVIRFDEYNAVERQNMYDVGNPAWFSRLVDEINYAKY